MESIQSVTLPVSEATVDSFFLSDGSLVKRGQQVLRYEHVILVTQWSQVERYATFYEVMITKEDEKTSVWKEEIRKHQGKDNKEIDALQKEYIQHLLKENQRVYLKVRDFVTSPFEGKLILKVVLKQKVKLGDPLFEVVEECGHSVQFSGMCAICGKDLSVADFHGPESYRAQIAMVHDSMGITVSRDVAQKMDMETAHRLRTEKKLSLILDLDQTLIHATADPTVGLWVDTTEKTGVFRFKLSDEPTEYFLKLRPGLHEFLSEIQMFYELHIYTMGTRLYANQVAKIIDPEKKLFKERVLSRNESGSFHRKSLHRLFPCDQSMVVVVDDRGDVWDWTDNLIRVHPYSYFLKTGDINSPALGPPVSFPSPPEDTSTMKDEIRIPVKSDDNDQELRILLKQLILLHEEFYKKEGNDVRNILPNMKKQVLKNCVIVFSGIIPKEIKAESSDIWKLATSFGAKCELEVTVKTTHLVATRWGTTKTRDAALYNIPIVTVSWLTTSLSYWSEQAVTSFLIHPNEDDLTVIKALQEELEHLNEEEFGMDAQVLLDVEAEINAWINEEEDEEAAKNGEKAFIEEPFLPVTTQKKNLSPKSKKRDVSTPEEEESGIKNKKTKLKSTTDNVSEEFLNEIHDEVNLKDWGVKESSDLCEEEASFSELLHDLDAELEVESEIESEE